MSSAFRGRAPSTTSRRRSASSPFSSIPTGTPATSPRRIGSRRSTRRTRSSPTRKSGTSTTASATRGPPGRGAPRVQGNGRAGGDPSGAVRRLQRAGPDHDAAGVLRDPPHMQPLRGDGPGRQGPVRKLCRHRPRPGKPHAQGEDPPRRRQRHAPQAARRGGGRARGRGGGGAALTSGRRGNLVIRVLIEVPRKLTKRQKEILSEYQELSDESPGPIARSFFEKVKEIFG